MPHPTILPADSGRGLVWWMWMDGGLGNSRSTDRTRFAVESLAWALLLIRPTRPSLKAKPELQTSRFPIFDSPTIDLFQEFNTEDHLRYRTLHDLAAVYSNKVSPSTEAWWVSGKKDAGSGGARIYMYIYMYRTDVKGWR